MEAVRDFELPALEAPAGLDVLPFLGEARLPSAPTIDVEAEAQAARARGHEEGYQAGFAEARAQLAPVIEALAAAAASVAAERDRVAAAVERDAVELALAIASQAMSAAVEVDPDRVVDVVRGALRRLVDRDRVTLLVNPDDLEVVRAAAEGLVAELGGIEHCDVQAERRVARGGAVVRTVEGEIDATLATKLERAREILVLELADARDA